MDSDKKVEEIYMKFDFVLPSKIRYGKGVVKELDGELNKLSAKK